MDSPAPMSADGRAAWEHTATDWRAAIDRGDVDAVDIACPTTSMSRKSGQERDLDLQ